MAKIIEFDGEKALELEMKGEIDDTEDKLMGYYLIIKNSEGKVTPLNFKVFLNGMTKGKKVSVDDLDDLKRAFERLLDKNVFLVREVKKRKKI